MKGELAIARQPGKRAAGGQAAGHKACTHCGATRTPQWREGPAGPKTLCNACGVKLVRKNRSALEAQRRAVGLGPPPKGTPLRHLLLLPDYLGSATHSGVSEADAAGGSITRGGTSAALSLLGSPEPRRPQRRAAVLAAERTAEFASSGEWPEKLSAPTARAKPQDSGISAASQQRSDAAEEVSWAPVHLQSAEGGGPLHRSLMDCTSAAVDLLTMTAVLPEPASSTPCTPPHMEAPTYACVNNPTRLGSTSERQQEVGCAAEDEATKAASRAEAAALHVRGLQLSADEALVEHFLRTHLPSKTPYLNVISAEADDSVFYAGAADAAVAAVAKVLAQKQAAAIVARSAMSLASRKLRGFLRSIDDQHQIVRLHKRARYMRKQ